MTPASMISKRPTMPSCYGNGDMNKHLRDTVKQIEASGVNVVGIGIQSNAVQSFYSKSIVVNDLKELPVVVARQLKAMLLGASK